MENVKMIREGVLKLLAAENANDAERLYSGLSLLRQPRWQPLGAMLVLEVLPEWQRREIVAVAMKRIEVCVVPDAPLNNAISLLQMPEFRPLGVKLAMDVLPDHDRQAVASLVLHRGEEARLEWEGLDADEDVQG